MKTITLLLCGLFSLTVTAQTCLNGGIETTPESEFEDLGDGAVLHINSDLIWQRCSLGQTWNGTTCNGTATRYTWQEALLAAQEADSEVMEGWRLPNLKELTTITERLCVRPAINNDVFPNTPPDDFWTSTPSMQDPLRSWVVAFFNASHSIKEKDRYIFVRLVRTRVE